jgi:hypothetical protein
MLQAMASVLNQHRQQNGELNRLSDKALQASGQKGVTEAEQQNHKARKAQNIPDSSSLNAFVPLYRQHQMGSHDQLGASGALAREAAALQRHHTDGNEAGLLRMLPHETTHAHQAALHWQRQENASRQQREPSSHVVQHTGTPVFLSEEEKAQLGKELLHTYWANHPHMQQQFRQPSELSRSISEQIQRLVHPGHEITPADDDHKVSLDRAHNVVGTLATQYLYGRQQTHIGVQSASQAAHAVIDTFAPLQGQPSPDELKTRMHSLHRTLQSSQLLQSIGRAVQQAGYNQTTPSSRISQHVPIEKQPAQDERSFGSSEIHQMNVAKHTLQNMGRTWVAQRGAMLANEAIKKMHANDSFENSPETVTTKPLWNNVVKPFIYHFYRPFVSGSQFQNSGLLSSLQSIDEEQKHKVSFQSETTATGGSGAETRRMNSIAQRIADQSSKSLPTHVQREVRNQNSEKEAQRLISQYPDLQRTLREFGRQIVQHQKSQYDGVLTSDILSAAGVRPGAQEDQGAASYPHQNKDLFVTSSEISGEKLPRGPDARTKTNRAFAQLLTPQEKEEVFGRIPGWYRRPADKATSSSSSDDSRSQRVLSQSANHERQMSEALDSISGRQHTGNTPYARSLKREHAEEFQR